jgi:hypothetical protein
VVILLLFEKSILSHSIIEPFKTKRERLHVEAFNGVSKLKWKYYMWNHTMEM